MEAKYKQNFIFDIDAQRTYLSKLSKRNLVNFLERLLNRDTKPFYIGQQEPYELVIDIFYEASRGLRQRIEFAIAELLFKLNVEFEKYNYLSDLLYLIGRLRIIEPSTYERRLMWLESRYFVCKYVDDYNKSIGEDIHLMILRSIASQVKPESKKRIENVCLASVDQGGTGENPYHFPLCYKILYEINENYASMYFGDLIDICYEKHLPLENELRPLCKLYESLITEHIAEKVGKYISNEQKALFLSRALNNIDKDYIFPYENNRIFSERSKEEEEYYKEHYYYGEYHELYELENIKTHNLANQITDKDIDEIVFLTGENPYLKHEIDPYNKIKKELYYLIDGTIPSADREIEVQNEDIYKLIIIYFQRKSDNIQRLINSTQARLKKLHKECRNIIEVKSAEFS